MAGSSKTWIDRILRAEGTIAFGQQMWTGISVAVGGGLVTSVISWFQGALAPFGFAGFVVVALLVAILILVD
jgi:fructose-specific phosphotransferase system IIC component